MIKLAFNPLTIILKENKLIGPNYIDWKTNLYIVLTAKECKFVLTEVCPQQPGEGATDKETQAYQKWENADEMMQCYISTSMSNVLLHQHQSMPTTYDMMISLKEMFGNQNRVVRLVSMRDLMNTIMVEGTLVRDHVLR